MQRYRINYQWLIGVFVGSLLLAITAFFVHRWQVDRKAGNFLMRAEEALASEDPLGAFDWYRKYVQLRPKEDGPRVKMAEAAIEVLNNRDVTARQRNNAYSVLDQTVRTTDNPGLRRELAKIVLNFRPQDAIGHIEALLVGNSNDSELNAMLVRAMFSAKDYNKAKENGYKLIGYDPKTDTFDTEKVALEGESDVYALLADVIVQKDKDPELARRVIDQMIAANPEDPLAYLRQSIFLSPLDEDESKVSLDKAYELGPTDPAILSRKGMIALNESNIARSEEGQEELATQKAEEAKSYFAIGQKEHPESVQFYQFMAQAQITLEETDEALKTLNEGIDKFDKAESVDLVIYKIDLLLTQEDYDAVDREIDRVKRLNRPGLQPIVDYEEARVLYRKKQWSEASKKFKQVRPLLFRFPKQQVMAGAMLGFSYENQGMYDLAFDAYTSVLNDYPKHSGAEKGRERMLARIQPDKQDRDADLDELVNKTLRLPEAEQDWDAVNSLVNDVIAKYDLEPARQMLLRAKVLIKRRQLAEAKQLIRDAAKTAPDDINVQYSAILLVLSDPEQGPVPATKLLDRLEKKWGRTARSIAQRADLIARQNPEDVSEQLRALLNDTGDLSEKERLQLDKLLGLKFEQLRKYDEASEFYEKAIVQEPNNLPLRIHVFELALRQRDDAAMRKAQESILDFVKSKNDATYLLTEVKRLIVNFGLKKIDRSQLDSCRSMLDKALEQRPKWHELHVTYGQLLLVMNEDLDLALKHFDEALDSGPAKANAVAIQVNLLADRGLYEQARERMELLNVSLRTRLLGKLEAEILLKTGDNVAGFAAAEAIAQEQPDDAKVQIWFANMAQGAGKLELASTSLRRALEIVPSDPDNWVRLIGLAIEQKKFDEVQDLIREAHLACDAEFLPMLTAKYFELLSAWQHAEKIYLASYADKTDNIAVSRRLADFYLLWAKKDEANLQRAAIYINRILRAANEGEAEADNPHVVWARQKAARLLFAKKDYQQSLKAERLLRQSAVESSMSTEESTLLVDILISRHDPQSLLKAIDLLTQLHAERRISKQGAIQLAALLSRTGQWDKAKTLLLEQISEHPDDPTVRTARIGMLIDQKEFKNAERALKNLSNQDPKNPLMVPLAARLASERGDQARLNQVLNSVLPKRSGAMTEAQLKSLLSVAQLATRYGAYDLAGELYQTYVERMPSEIYEYTKYLAYHGDCEQAVDLMKRLYPDRPDDVLQLANRMLSSRRDEIGDKYDAPVDRMIDAALRDDPDSVTRQLARAEAYESQGKHKESIATYDRLLRRDDLPTQLRAMAMNNLGFQLALLNQRVDEAEQLVTQAMETFGPVEDMLDTRAVVRIAQEEYDLAIEDMKLALAVSQDPIKYYHLAKAYALAGNDQAALKAWEEAQKHGFKKESLPKLEKPSFDETRQKLESLQTQSANL